MVCHVFRLVLVCYCADGERFAGHSFPWAFPGFEKVGLAMLQVIDGEQSGELLGVL